MRIRSRDRKSEKMSDIAKRAAGIVLIVSGIMLSIFHVHGSVHEYRTVYSTGNRSWQLNSIPVKQDGTVRINTADETELETLPGIGKVYASLLLEERNRNGSFYYPEDLTAVHGIGNATLKKLYPDIDLTME